MSLQVGSLDFTGVVAGKKSMEDEEALARAEMEWKRKEEEERLAREEKAAEETRREVQSMKKKQNEEKAAFEAKVQAELERNKLHQQQAEDARAAQDSVVEVDMDVEDLPEAPSADVSGVAESLGERVRGASGRIQG